VRRLVPIALAAGLVTAVGTPAHAQHSAWDGAQMALERGEADNALSLLSSAPASDAEAHNLRCRVYFTLELWDQAVRECEQAVQQDGQNSNNHMWLGRALGEKAGKASFMSAYGLAKRTRAEFEQAAQLNPRNAEALADLGEFYSSAPGVVGGGMDKAAGVASQLDKVDPARAHELRARIAEGNKDYGTAEREFRAAVQASAHPAFQSMTLASFMRRRQRFDEMEAAIQHGFALAQRDHTAAVALYNGSTVLLRANRNPQLAAKLLDAYLNGTLKTEEAPAFVAHVARARVALQLGDKDTAKRERDAALALASEYKPARDLKF
jgi:tetratricopeptide (TPR) repeat protein